MTQRDYSVAYHDQRLLKNTCYSENSCHSGLGVFHFLSKQEPSIITDLHAVVLWICSNNKLFSGKVTQPTFAGTDEEERQEMQEGDKDPVLIIFEYREDMDLCLDFCVHVQNLQIECTPENADTLSMNFHFVL